MPSPPSLPSLFLQSLQHIQGDTLVEAALQHHPAHAAYEQGRLFVVAVGKAAASMAAGACAVFPDVPGMGVTKDDHGQAPSGWVWYEASHPVPDQRSEVAAQALLAKAERMGPEDRMLLLLSGGASALLTAPIEGLTRQDIAALTGALLHAGASIHELNLLRRSLSRIKSGGLLQALHPARGWTLAISDVPGDTPAAIGSGITVATRPSPQAALDVLTSYGLHTRLPNIAKALHAAKATDDARLSPASPLQDHMPFQILASNAIWQQHIGRLVQAQGFADEVVTLSPGMDQPVETVLTRLKNIIDTPPRGHRRLTLIGGEPTLRVQGSGKGGRMQHLALLCAKAIHGQEDIEVLAAASDGTDGPTDAAGALVNGETWRAAQRHSCDGDAAIANHDSYAFHQAAGTTIKTGATGTNVCDIVLVWQGCVGV